MKKGFTLIEVLVAMMILVGAIVALSQSWSGSLFSFRKSQNINTIVSLLKKKTTELEIKYKDGSFTEIPEEEAGDFGSDYQDFKWASKTRDLEFPDLSQILTSKEGGADEMVLMVVKQMTEFFSKNTKELRVTVIWTSGGRSVEYSVTTYLVNKQVGGLSGLPGAPSGSGNESGSTPQGDGT